MCVFIVSSTLKLRGQGRDGVVFEIWTKRGVMKKIAQKRGGGVLLERGGFPNCFISFPSQKHVFITIGLFLSGKYSHSL